MVAEAGDGRATTTHEEADVAYDAHPLGPRVVGADVRVDERVRVGDAVEVLVRVVVRRQ